jgi:mannose-6-phosphate isomerase-like protein (cupin superfamily)
MRLVQNGPAFDGWTPPARGASQAAEPTYTPGGCTAPAGGGRSAAPEMHKNWTDVYYVLDGEVTVRYGDSLEGGKEGVDGNVNGGEIVGNVKRQKLVAGDVASSPAGIPHFYEVEPGKTVTYMTVKVGHQH